LNAFRRKSPYKSSLTESRLTDVSLADGAADGDEESVAGRAPEQPSAAPAAVDAAVGEGYVLDNNTHSHKIFPSRKKQKKFFFTLLKYFRMGGIR